MFGFVVVLALAAGAATQPEASATQQPAGQQPASPQPPAGQSPATTDGGFANETDKGSYALGFDFGRMLRNRKVEVVAEPLMAGLKDALGGGQARLSDQEVTVIARGIQNAAMRRLQQERAELSAKNRAAGKAFLEGNQKRSGVVALPSGLQYEVLRAGNGPKPTADDSVKVNFRGTLLDGTVFDSSENRTEPVVVRANSVIPGWTEALQLMSVGSKWKLFVPVELGYGDRTGENIPPGSTLIFEVELLSIEPKAKDAKVPDAPGQ